jgi:hypothetical protein
MRTLHRAVPLRRPWSLLVLASAQIENNQHLRIGGACGEQKILEGQEWGVYWLLGCDRRGVGGHRLRGLDLLLDDDGHLCSLISTFSSGFLRAKGAYLDWMFCGVAGVTLCSVMCVRMSEGDDFGFCPEHEMYLQVEGGTELITEKHPLFLLIQPFCFFLVLGCVRSRYGQRLANEKGGEKPCVRFGAQLKRVA